MGDGNVGVTAGKALGGFTRELTELVNCPTTCYKHTIMLDKTETIAVTMQNAPLVYLYCEQKMCNRMKRV